MKRLFGTAGVRGATNVDIDAALCLRVAQAFGTWVRRSRKRAGRICVAHDTRFGARPLTNAVIAGLSLSGCEVVDYGVLPSGAFSLNIKLSKTDGGILITGSHMPYDRIGLLVFLEDGSCAPHDVTDRIEEILDKNVTLSAKPEEIGAIHQGSTPTELYVEELLRHLDRKAIGARKMKVLIDPANGAASVLARETFERAGCEVVSINSSFQAIPNRPSEPRDGTVEEAKSICKVLKLDLGLCLDVDADRALFVSGRGETISEDTVGGIFAQAELKKDDLCVVPVNSSGLIEWVAQRAGARLEYCRVGQPETIKAVKALGAVFSYEESGKYYFARSFLWADGIYSGLKMLEIMGRDRRSLPELAGALPTFHQAKASVEVPQAAIEGVWRGAVERLRADDPEPAARDVEIDGFKRIYRDHAWLLIRSSGTEPLIRVFADASDPERARALAARGAGLVHAALKG